MRPIVYSLQFRGQATAGPDGAVRKQATAPACALVTRLTARGVEGRFVWPPFDEDGALLDSTLTFRDEHRFDEDGTILFSHGNAVRIKGHGQLIASRDPHLSHGSVVWEVSGGEGQFDGASGLITSNLLVSDTGELTDNQLGVIFASTGAAE